MLITNIRELFENKTLNIKNYLIVNRGEAQYLIENGFMPIAREDEKFIFKKNDEISQLIYRKVGDKY